MDLDSEDESFSRPPPLPIKKSEAKPEVPLKKELEPKTKQTNDPKEAPAKKPPPP